MLGRAEMSEKIVIGVIIGVLLFVMITGQASYDEEYLFEFTFEEDQEGWETGFADLPKDHNVEIYEKETGHVSLPSGLEGNAIYLSGHNRSDDLFMFLIKLIEGLKPDTTYRVNFIVDLASNTPEGMMGIGGSPGESVYVKAGAVTIEPELYEASDGWLRINIDKGNQAREGLDMVNIGNVANPNIDMNTYTGEEYAVMTLDPQGLNFTVTTDNDGMVWVIVGTDSGFEGLTTVYYDAITITFTEEK